MKYGIPTIAAKNLTSAASPILGWEGENVYFSEEEGIAILGLEQSAADAAVEVAYPHGFSFPVAGVDLFLRAKGPIKEGGSAITVTLDIETPGGADTATATVAAPQFSNDGSGLYPVGAAFDFLVDSDDALKITALTGLNAITGGEEGNEFEIVTLPSEDSWVQARCVRSKEATLPVPNTVNIACGRESAAYVKRGRTEIPNLSLTQANIGYGASLTKVNGHRLSFRVDIKDDGRILKERQIFLGARLSGSAPIGDGEDESEVSVEGQFESYCIFNAETDLS